jgi:hypothetical protein
VQRGDLARKIRKTVREAQQADLDPTLSSRGKQRASRKRRRIVEDNEDDDKINAAVTNVVQDPEDGVLEQ